MQAEPKLHLRYVYRLEGADALPANLALEPYLACLAGDEPGSAERKAHAFGIIEEAQVEARTAGWAGDIWTGEGIGSGPFVSLTPGRLTGGGTGILALYWTVKDEDVTYVVSAMLLPYLGTPIRTKRFELHSPEFQFDMSSWCIEKTSDQVRDVRYIQRLLDRTPDLPVAFKEQLMSHLGHLMWSSTKLLAFSCGGEWGTDDARTALEEEEGLDLLLVKYGLRDETSKQEEARLLRELLADVRTLLDGPRVPNLRELHDLLDDWFEDSDIVEQLREWEDEVQMGALSWEEFCKQARTMLGQED
ncbi:hypothetical protein J7643_03950 [bacterium]|nr:hypothetical protein [bacterium]